jgi:hypothetical protein
VASTKLRMPRAYFPWQAQCFVDLDSQITLIVVRCSFWNGSRNPLGTWACQMAWRGAHFADPGDDAEILTRSFLIQSLRRDLAQRALVEILHRDHILNPQTHRVKREPLLRIREKHIPRHSLDFPLSAPSDRAASAALKTRLGGRSTKCQRNTHASRIFCTADLSPPWRPWGREYTIAEQTPDRWSDLLV